MKEMFIGEKKKKPYLVPILIVAIFCALGYFGKGIYDSKLTQAHTKGFVEGCANLIAYEKQMATRRPMHPQEGFIIMQQCLQFKQMIENPQPPQIEPRGNEYEETI